MEENPSFLLGFSSNYLLLETEGFLSFISRIGSHPKSVGYARV